MAGLGRTNPEAARIALAGRLRAACHLRCCYLNLTAAVLVSPAFTVTLTLFVPRSGWMNLTECGPAGTLTPTFGVLPSGLPSRITLETGIELRFKVAVPEPLLVSVVFVSVVFVSLGPGETGVDTGGVLPVSLSSMRTDFSALPSSNET